MNKVLQRREVCVVNNDFCCFREDCGQWDGDRAVCSVSGEPPQVEEFGPRGTGRKMQVTKRINGKNIGAKRIRQKWFPSVADIANAKTRLAQEKRRAELLGGAV